MGWPKSGLDQGDGPTHPHSPPPYPRTRFPFRPELAPLISPPVCIALASPPMSRQ